MKDTMKMVAADKLHPNPDNPRRALGDLSELAESIKKNGIMQNLTVMPLEGKPGEYMIIMGHRRHAAAVQTGLKELPCRVMEKLERSDQVAAMLAENLQRSNLTPYEEGQGFQLMLNLGETEQSICEKTGFGKTTVRHRINIARLDQEKLKKRQDDPSFQLSLTDLVALEKVPDIKMRNKILDEAEDSRDLAFLAQRTAAEIKREDNLARAIPMLEKAGIKPLPDKAVPEIYNSSKWQVVEVISLDSDLPESYRPEQAGELYHYKSYREIKILKRPEKKTKGDNKPKTETEKRLQEEEARQKKNRKQLLEQAKEADAVRREFILGVIGGKIPRPKPEDLAKAQEALWRVIYDNSACVSRSGCIAFRAGKDDIYSASAEEREEAGKWADKLGMVDQMLIIAHRACGCRELVGSNGEYSTRAAENAKKLYAALRLFGLRPDKDTKLILDGKHELYFVKPAPEKPAQIEDKAAGADAGQKSGAKAGEATAAGKKESKKSSAPGAKAQTAMKPAGTKAEPKAGDRQKPTGGTKSAAKDKAGARGAQELQTDAGALAAMTAPDAGHAGKEGGQPVKASPVAEPIAKAGPQPKASEKAMPNAGPEEKAPKGLPTDGKAAPAEGPAAKAESQAGPETRPVETAEAGIQPTAADSEPRQEKKPATGTKAA